ncbi:MAG: cupin domain-containing protein [Planctomycetes bacterium]|nr:cupin domain-containing protein [Planctomycetota bacterium]MCB9887765.1 cupin domain-containing protein [Planctomycetota bacterium]
MHCADLSANLAFFTALGFRLDTIFPADDPRLARLWGHGAWLCLQRGEDGGGHLRVLGADCADGATRVAPNGARVEFVTADLASPEPVPLEVALRQPLVTAAAGPWIEGRAGMRYRDLIPGRCGGRLIASRIRIERGGPVPDYVHFHEVAAQLIYCRAGWVRVVYEDQGPPFVLEPGDCVVQPPGIRHRVLECSDGTEVIEVSSPAEHATRVDHALQLPTAVRSPERQFGGQRFVHHRRQQAEITRSADWPGWEVRDTGIGAATRGALAVVVRRPGSGDGRAVDEGGQLRLWYVLAGAGEFTCGGGRTAVEVDTVCLAPPGATVEWSAADAGLELLEVRLPGEVAVANGPARKS